MWNTIDLESDRPCSTRLGEATLSIVRLETEWHLYIESAAGPARRTAQGWRRVTRRRPPGELRRWVAGDEEGAVTVVPAMPDRPLVVRPDTPVALPAGRQAVFYVEVPVWLRVVAGRSGKVELCEVPSVVLSKTWFGDPTAGVMAYSLRTPAVRSIGEAGGAAHLALVPVRIVNNSRTELGFERLCLHVEHLAVFEVSGRLWTGEVRVCYRGADQASQIEVSPHPPGAGSEARRLSEPRVAPTGTLVKKSFQLIRLLAGMEER